MVQRKIVEIIQFTDPVCTWCWGWEPIQRKLEIRYQNLIKIKYIMGGLVKDIRDFYDKLTDIGGNADYSNSQIIKHWLESSDKHGMPVQDQGFGLFSDDHPSSYPLNIAYKAAQMESEEAADRLLRRIREATAAEARQTNKTEVLIELASETGLDLPKFIQRFNDGSAKAAFEEDLKITDKYNVRGFPSFLIKYGEKELLLKGYQGFDAIQSVIRALTDDSVKDTEPEKSEAAVLKFIKKYNRVAAVEIQTAFDLFELEMKALIESLKEKKLIRVVKAGNGSFIELSGKAGACDFDAGICSF